jgi:hypothetical protein
MTTPTDDPNELLVELLDQAQQRHPDCCEPRSLLVLSCDHKDTVAFEIDADRLRRWLTEAPAVDAHDSR